MTVGDPRRDVSSDVLERASRALLEETSESSSSARFTRARVMASLHRHERKRRSRLAWLVPIAAVLVGSSAWAASSGHLSFAAVTRVTGDAEPASAPAPITKPALGRARFKAAFGAVREAPVATPEAAPTAAPPAEATPPAEPVAEKTAVAAATPSSRAPTPFGVAPKASAIDPELELYRVAHRAHFSAGDYSTALRAWNEYLKKAPRGRFTLEANYNRAICLVRLGRAAEARPTLQAFANGKYGEYRRESARALLDAI